MVSLKSVQSRFEMPFEVVEGGSGQLRGVIGEAPQTAQPSNIFVAPRQVLRVPAQSLAGPRMVIRTPAGGHFLLGNNGRGEVAQGTLWNSFRLFEINHKVTWKRRVKEEDLITGLAQDVGLVALGTVWCVTEVIDRENLDRKLHESQEQIRFLCGAEVLADDILDGRKVIRSEVQLGLRVGVLG